DAGAVETNYALSFSTEPSNSQANTNFTAGVTLTESGNPFAPSVTIPLTLTGTGSLTGGSAATSSGLATYALQVNTVGTGDTLTANLTLNAGLTPAVAISTTSGSFDIGIATPTVGLSLSSASITYGTLETFTATVPTPATGTVTFYNNGTTSLGTGTVSGGTATFSSSTLTAGSYSITAAYSGDSNYTSATSSPQTLTISQADQAALAVTGMPPTAQIYGATFTVEASGGSGTGAITFAATGACSVNANSGLVTMTSGTGTCSVTATKAADTNYNSITSPAATVNAALASQTITITTPAPATEVYKGTFPVAATSSSGLTVALTVDAGSTGVCSLASGTVTMNSGTGTCTIDANQLGNTNYSA
ncbi:MAG: Ig-like domain repeat protein, partial [Mycobacterium sp.]|nr:Ig-like domain repeat protein [Mycobacterium sp.]